MGLISALRRIPGDYSRIQPTRRNALEYHRLLGRNKQSALRHYLRPEADEAPPDGFKVDARQSPGLSSGHNTKTEPESTPLRYFDTLYRVILLLSCFSSAAVLPSAFMLNKPGPVSEKPAQPLVS